jgi:hypothetical protein
MLGSCLSQPIMQKQHSSNNALIKEDFDTATHLLTPKAQKELEDKIILKKEFLDVSRRSRQKSHTPNNQFKYFHRGGVPNHPLIL